MTPTTSGGAAPTLSLVVPLYDEEERLAEHSDELGRFVAGFPAGSELILVDDGSGDATADVARAFLAAHPSLRGRLLRRPHEGKGAAVRAGLAVAEGDYAGFCDVDLSTPLAQLEDMLGAARRGRVLAIGSRDVAASRLVRPQGRVRETLGRTYNRLVQLTLAPGISDTQCGAKVASRAVWAAVLPHCREHGFAWDVEAIAIARKLGVSIREVAVDWSHDDRTRVRLLRDGAAMVAAVPRILGTVRGVPVDERPEGEASGVFDADQAATLIESDTGHWWFRSKGGIVSSVIRRHRTGNGATPILADVGAGAGGVTAVLGWPPGRVVAVEGSEALVRIARGRHGIPAVVGSTGRLPLPERSVGVVTLLDVIEHLDDPVGALRDALRSLEPGGIVVVTVPAHPWLWSRADELLGHVRRYTRPVLRSHLEQAGFEVAYCSHVFSWLVPPVWLQRRLATTADAQLGLDRTSVVVDRLALALTRAEQAVVARVPLPFGTTIVAVGRRPSAAPGAPGTAGPRRSDGGGVGRQGRYRGARCPTCL